MDLAILSFFKYISGTTNTGLAGSEAKRHSSSGHCFHRQSDDDSTVRTLGLGYTSLLFARKGIISGEGEKFFFLLFRFAEWGGDKLHPRAAPRIVKCNIPSRALSIFRPERILTLLLKEMQGLVCSFSFFFLFFFLNHAAFHQATALFRPPDLSKPAKDSGEARLG